MLTFTVIAKGRGRAGIIKTSHGVIETPAFIPVGTKATIKSLLPESVRDLVGAQAVLANTYHLYLQPGHEIVKKAGGLGKFMNWQGPTFTDSGGFQAFSLQGGMKSRQNKFGKKNAEKVPSSNSLAFAKASAGKQDPNNLKIYDQTQDLSAYQQSPALAKVDDDGVTFKSIIDGSTHRFTPESSVDIQHALGADIIFTLDECASPEADYEMQKKAIERTHSWAQRCLERHAQNGVRSTEHGGRESKEPHDPYSAPHAPSLFGIVQGGRHEDLRRESARAIAGMKTVNGAEFDGFGIGGTFEKKDMATAVGWVCDELPENKPRHLLGIGEPEDIILGIENGADTFDCVAPTRLGRNGAAYVSPKTAKEAGSTNGRINLFNSRFVSDFGPLDSHCNCYTCANYSRAYLAHLFRAEEMLAATLTSIHNLYFLVTLTKEARTAIVEGKFDEFKDQALK